MCALFVSVCACVYEKEYVCVFLWMCVSVSLLICVSFVFYVLVGWMILFRHNVITDCVTHPSSHLRSQSCSWNLSHVAKHCFSMRLGTIQIILDSKAGLGNVRPAKHLNMARKLHLKFSKLLYWLWKHIKYQEKTCFITKTTLKSVNNDMYWPADT